MAKKPTCGNCRFWSEMIVRETKRFCLVEDVYGQYTTSAYTCSKWKSGHHGAVDSPPDYGERARAAYAQEEEGL